MQFLSLNCFVEDLMYFCWFSAVLITLASVFLLYVTAAHKYSHVVALSSVKFWQLFLCYIILLFLYIHYFCLISNVSNLCHTTCIFPLSVLYVILIGFFNLFGTFTLSNVLYISLVFTAFKTINVNSSVPFSLFLSIVFLGMNVL